MKITNLLTQADRDMFDRIDRDCIAMHVPTPPKTFIELSVQDGAGVEVERYTDRAHSWVRNMYNVMMQYTMGINSASASGYGAGLTSLKTTDGALGNVVQPIAPINNLSLETGYLGPASDDTYGILVGTGSGIEGLDSFALTSKIPQGVASGQLSHAQQTLTPSWSDVTKKFTALQSRIFNNNSGASIIVSEVAWVANYYWNSLKGKYCMLCRDLLASPVTVPNAGQLTVTYTIEMTFPA